MTDASTGVPIGRSQVKRHALWLIPTVLAVVVLIIVGIVFFGSPSSGVPDRQQLASVRQVCTEWTGDSAASLGTSSASAACSTMADWMNRQLQNGDMTGSMIWGSAASMDSACRQWMHSGSRASLSAAVATGWCNDMVGWMQQHVGNWGNWMMDGNMGGNSGG